MSGGREGHSESVGFAQAEISALENRLLAARIKVDETLAAVVQAVGEQPETEPGRNAFEWTAMMNDRLDELLRFCDNIKTELSRYAGGF